MFLKLFHFLIPLWCLWFAESADTSADDKPEKDANGGGTEDKKSFTQAELDRMFVERAKQAEQSAVSKLLQGLGFANSDELKTLVQSAKDAEAARLSDLEKVQKELSDHKARAEKAEAEAEQAITLANTRLIESVVLAEAARPEYKFLPDAMPDVWRFVDRSKLAVDETGNVTGAADAVKAVAKDKPYMVQQQGTTATVGTPPRQRTIAGQTSQVQPVNGTPTQYEAPLVKF